MPAATIASAGQRCTSRPSQRIRPAAGRTRPEIARSVGYVFQHPSSTLFANTLREELSFGPRNIGIDPAETERDITRALAIVNLSDLDLGKSPFALSHGQQKRIALASVLILDEPCAGLDPVARDRFLRWLQDLSARPHAPTLVMVGNQDILTPRGDAEELAERIPGAELVVISGAAHGFMIEHGTTFNRILLDFLARVERARAERPVDQGATVEAVSGA